MERIAVALERIAVALEQANENDPIQALSKALEPVQSDAGTLPASEAWRNQ